ncbi:glycosyl hydrolase family 18 protein [Neobacillus citreus]|uniref:Glycosyl hydrolase family 18 protein n=1 Tax=Neobacillus citreus TaxID=2833578 RepID=A0A942STX5_9BACI|nr:glycosyl hydrolase family 18 protein [Neobacillus citreus]MCH6265445.1 glycosyl hydrolase family 18 protein [Neobacillus citreus]
MARIEYQKSKPISPKWLLGGLAGSIFLIISSIFLFFYPFASEEKKVYFNGSSPILFKGAQQGNALIEGNNIYVPFHFLKESMDHSITYDEKSKSVIITTKDKVVQMPTDSLTYFVNEKPVSLQLSPIKSMEGDIYLALDSILAFYPIQYHRLPQTGAIWIQQDGETYQTGRIIDKDINGEKLRLRTKASWQSPYTAEVNQKEAVSIEGEKEDFYLVRKANGIGGYIKKEYVKKEESVKISIVRESKSFQLPKITGPIHLTWEAVYTKNPNAAAIPEMAGINVVSPTWFSLAGEDGSIKNLASLEYSKWAQAKGFHVWGVFSNSFDPVLTNKAFKDFETRQKIIRQLLYFSQMFQLQGINFDIENVNPEDGPMVTQLIREAAPYLHEAGLTVSMDITFSAGENNNWSSFYERSKLADIADYLIIMAYDEHTAATGPGSVASLPWVERNLQNLLTEVPKEKLILGVPLYARLWKEQMKADGTKEVIAQALSMEKVKAWLTERGLQPAYDEESGQNYAEYYDETEKANYKIWIEDEMSLKKRAEMAVKYQLAGVGSWSRLFADQTAWTALNTLPEKNITKNE